MTPGLRGRPEGKSLRTAPPSYRPSGVGPSSPTLHGFVPLCSREGDEQKAIGKLRKIVETCEPPPFSALLHLGAFVRAGGGRMHWKGESPPSPRTPGRPPYAQPLPP